jgi:sulfur-carrier protein
MVKIEFLGPIAHKGTLSLNINSLDELSSILKSDIELSAWLENCAVAINDKIVCDKNRTLNHGDVISILPPVCGG